MVEPEGPLRARLRLAESLLSAIEDNVSSLQRLLSEVHTVINTALQEAGDPSHERELDALRREVDQMRQGALSRAVIERAKGILMQGYGLSEAQSFEILNEMSKREHRKVRDIAADVVDGARPTSLPPAPEPEPPATPATRRAPGGGLAGANGHGRSAAPPNNGHLSTAER